MESKNLSQYTNVKGKKKKKPTKRITINKTISRSNNKKMLKKLLFLKHFLFVGWLLIYT